MTITLVMLSDITGVDPTTLLVVSLIGHAIGSLVLWLVAEAKKKNAKRGDLVEKFVGAMARAIEQEKDNAQVSGDQDDASVVRSITRRIAGELVQEGIEPDFTTMLEALGLNQTRKLGPLLDKGKSTQP